MRLLLFSFILFGAHSLWAIQKPPKLTYLRGQITFKTAEREKSPLKVSAVFSEAGHIETAEGTIARVDWGDKNYLMVPSNSHLEISFKKEQPQFKLIKGQARFLFHEGPNLITTPTVEIAYKGEDLVLQYDVQTGLTSAHSLKGDGFLRPIGVEQSTGFKNEQSVGFQAVMVDGEPAFDILLKGQKIVQGHPIDAKDLSKEEVKNWLTSMALPVVKKKVVVKAKKLPGQICEAPFAKFNECAWFCLNNPKGQKNCRVELEKVSCVRKRCNANGQWGEEWRLPASVSGRCETAAPMIRQCDY